MARHESGSVLRILFGWLDVAAATGAVSTTKKFGAYIKQIVTNTEWLVAALGGAATQMRTAQSASTTVEEDAYKAKSAELKAEAARADEALARLSDGSAGRQQRLPSRLASGSNRHVNHDHFFPAFLIRLGEHVALCVKRHTTALAVVHPAFPAPVGGQHRSSDLLGSCSEDGEIRQPAMVVWEERNRSDSGEE